MPDKHEFWHWLEDVEYWPKLKGKVLCALYVKKTNLHTIAYVELAEVEP